MDKKRRIVVKVGTNVMTNKDNRIVRPVLRRLVEQIAELYERGIITILVSSAVGKYCHNSVLLIY